MIVAISRRGWRGMLDVYDNRIFHLHNDQISYALHVLPNGQLGHLYFGAPMHGSQADWQYLIDSGSKSGGTAKFSADSDFTLADTAQEYPVWGTTDYRQGALAISQGQTPLYPDFQYDHYQVLRGKKRDLGFPRTFGEDDEVETLQITLVDHVLALRLVQSYSLFQDQAVIVRSQTITNESDQAVMLDRMLSSSLDLPQGQFEFVHLSGTWARERQVKTQNLVQGRAVVESLRGASSHQQNPFVALRRENADLNHGEVFGMNLVYSGNFIAEAEVNEWAQTRMMIGIHPTSFTWKLAPADSFSSPEAVLSYSDQGLSGLGTVNTRFIRRHIIAPRWQNRPRPIVLNSWEAAYFDLTEEKLTTLLNAAEEVGIECFAVDDGWFGQRDDDRSSLGDWVTDKKKFPQGIKRFSETVHDHGLLFGLWFEPEMVSPGSQLIKAHPDWVVRPDKGRYSIARGQYVLDFANPAVVANVFNQMKAVIQAARVDYVKWDMNRNITEAFSPYLQQQDRPQNEFFHRYMMGVYQLYQLLLTEFPDLLIEGCAGGGGRFDLGILYYSPQIWVSDNSDAIARLSIQSGTALGYPLEAMSNHVTAVPNHQMQRITPLATRYNVAQFGTLGYELDLTKLTAPELATVKKQITWYKQQRPLVWQGAFQQLQAPAFGDKNTVAWTITSPDQEHIRVGFFRILADAAGRSVDFLKIPSADPTTQYRIDETGSVVSGDVLRRVGLRLPYQFNGANQTEAVLQGDFQSAVIELTAVKKVSN